MRTFYQNGFTLVETLVALFILSIAITGSFAVLTTNSNAADTIKNSYVASGLVQEGIEVARNIRDDEWLNTGYGTALLAGSHRVQWDTCASAWAGIACVVPVAPNPDTTFLLFDSVTGKYTYTASINTTATIFQRTLVITDISNQEKRIVVTVTWLEHGATRSVSAEDHLINWR